MPEGKPPEDKKISLGIIAHEGRHICCENTDLKKLSKMPEGSRFLVSINLPALSIIILLL